MHGIFWRNACWTSQVATWQNGWWSDLDFGVPTPPPPSAFWDLGPSDLAGDFLCDPESDASEPSDDVDRIKDVFVAAVFELGCPASLSCSNLSFSLSAAILLRYSSDIFLSCGLSKVSGHYSKAL